jgi:hypothetical protein
VEKLEGVYLKSRMVDQVGVADAKLQDAMVDQGVTNVTQDDAVLHAMLEFPVKAHPERTLRNLDFSLVSRHAD